MDLVKIVMNVVLLVGINVININLKAAAEKIKFERRRYEQKERDLAIDISRAIGRTRKHR